MVVAPRILDGAADMNAGLQNEQEWYDAETVLHLVADHCREAIFIREAATGGLLYASPAVERILGVPKSCQPKTREEFLEFVHPEDRPGMMALYRKALDGPAVVEWRLMRPDGTLRQMVTRAIPLRKDGAVTHIAGISEDVTEQHAAAAERRTHAALALAAGRSAMWEMATALAHEIHQPLFSIHTYARSCMRKIESGAASMDEVRASCERIVGEAERSTEVVRRLRDLARGRPPVARPEDLNAMVEEIMRLAGPELLPTDVSVQLEPDAASAVVQADRVEIQLVLLNLIRNAVEATADTAVPHRLWITLASGGVEAQVSVSDNGCGIEPRDTDRMFDPFFSTKADGTGMGLSICRTILEAHGGRLWAAPRDGGGTVFAFTLPLAPPAAPGAAGAPNSDG